MTLDHGPAAGISYADLYLLGATDPAEAAARRTSSRSARGRSPGRRSTGPPRACPPGQTSSPGSTWQEFLTNADEPTEPVEFVVQACGRPQHHRDARGRRRWSTRAPTACSPTPDLQADYLVVKPPARAGTSASSTCRSPTRSTTARPRTSPTTRNYNTQPGRAGGGRRARSGSPTRTPSSSYQVTACTGRFSGDVPGQICDTAGEIDSGTGTWDLHARTPSIRRSRDRPARVQGVLGRRGLRCGDPDHGHDRLRGAGDDPSILALFPNNAPHRTPTVVETDT